MEHTLRPAKTGTVRQSDKHHEHLWNTTKKEGTKKEAAAAKSFHPRSLDFFKTEGNHKCLDMRDQHLQFRGYGRKY